MIAVRFSRSRSWHLMAVAGTSQTLCGRFVPSSFTSRGQLPGNERTCERCAVIASRLDLTPDGGGDYGTFVAPV